MVWRSFAAINGAPGYLLDVVPRMSSERDGGSVDGRSVFVPKRWDAKRP